MGSAQDIVAIFIAEFQVTKGNIIEWSLVSDESVNLENVEFNVLPSGVHAIDKDVIYITKDSYQGVAVYRRISTDEVGMRGARMISVGVLLANSTRPRAWNHISALKRFAIQLEDKYEDRTPLEEYFERHKAPLASPSTEEPWNGWEEELSRATMDHPAFHLSHVLHVMGISSLTLFKHALGRRRILIHTHPPVESACLLAQLAAVISTGEEGIAGVHAHRINVLGVVGLTDLGRIEKETSRGNGWIACTTDAIFLEKPNLYDLLIDLTSSSDSRPYRPALSVSRPTQSSNGRKSYKLQTVRFTWSDVRLWTELERILEADSDHGSHSHPAPVKTSWTDPWRIYEDVCVVCAGIWVGWKPSSSVKLIGQDDGLSSAPVSPSDQEATLNGSTTEMSSNSHARPSTDTKKPRRSSVDPRLGKLSVLPTTRARVTTLSLLSTFHNHTDFLLSKLAEVLLTSSSATVASGSSPSADSGALVLTPKDVMAFDLGPGSDLDARFIEWLGETRGRKLKVKRGWKDLVGFMFGL